MATYPGTSGSDNLNGTSGADIFYAKGGNDTINANGGNDTIYGAAGRDTIDGGSGSDLIFGGSGDDNIKGGSGDDEIWGGAGDDVLRGNGGDDQFHFGNGHGNDTIADFTTDDTLVLTGNIDPDDTFAYTSSSTNVGPDGVWNTIDDTYAFLVIDTGEGLIGLLGVFGFYSGSADFSFIEYD